MSEPFGQRFVGLVDSHPTLSASKVAEARGAIRVEIQHGCIFIELQHLAGVALALPEQFTLEPEQAYALYIELRNKLFGSNEYASFKSVE